MLAVEGNFTQSPSNPSSTNSTSDADRTATSVTPARRPDRLKDPQVLVVVVSWDTQCKGMVQLKPLRPSSTLSSQLCYPEQNETEVKAILGNVCHQRRGCSGRTDWHREELTTTASQLRQEPSSSTSETTCYLLRVSCSGWSPPTLNVCVCVWDLMVKTTKSIPPQCQIFTNVKKILIFVWLETGTVEKKQSINLIMQILHWV